MLITKNFNAWYDPSVTDEHITAIMKLGVKQDIVDKIVHQKFFWSVIISRINHWYVSDTLISFFPIEKNYYFPELKHPVKFTHNSIINYERQTTNPFDGDIIRIINEKGTPC
ncbi:hypothetical protein FDI40_gp563 [Agrobacterium phage Atu_ph07]|uniref:Uncharacterized protein n=1 Tax=Agrobacterium phage Atu_ph07 TaxID=2024264 RepID=A0A2L0V0H2_9CAUD|nr:hypothetical protein FDI40_gp563 [Agrobacterium phage Atu_ph07]AUZ95322.1 hypothetical protein [Agrobacterium phage Atu_ph07]